MIRWIAAAGAFFMSLDSMVNIAFPAMAAWFECPPDSMRWVIISYVLSYSLTSFAGGMLGDRVGLARVFQLGLATSAAAHVITASAPTFGWLIGGRVIQGVGGGMIYGTVPGLVTLAAAPEARGRALGFLNASMGLAGVLGPSAAGPLIELFGWQAVFASRIPLALGVLAWAWRGLPAGRAANVGSRLVRPGDLARRPVVRACALSFLANAGVFAIWLLAPFYLVNRRGFDAVVTGLLFMLTPLATTLAAPIGGRLADRAGARLPGIAGLALEAVGLIALGQVGEHTPAVLVAAALFVTGFGLGLFQVPNMTDVMIAFPPGQQGAAGGLTFMARTLGVVTGVATFGAVFAATSVTAGFDAGFTTVFGIAAAAVGVATALAVLTGRPPGSARLAPR